MTQRTCAMCGVPMVDQHKLAKYCGAHCRNRINDARCKARPVRQHEHGTRTGYARGCRCSDCRAYNASYSKLVRARQPARPRVPRSDKGVKKTFIKLEDHGTTRAYAFFRCRCDDCRRAASDYNRVWRDANRDKYNGAMARYRRLHPEKVSRHSAARAAAAFDEESLAYCEIIHKDPCVYCGSRSKAIDHIQPVAAGGDSRWDNLAPACMKCNGSKSAKTLLAFLLYRL